MKPKLKASALFILCAITSTLIVQAQAQTSPDKKTVSWDGESSVRYEPSKCPSGDKNKVYFAVGKKVYSLPYGTHISIRGMGAEERSKLPKRPAPDEPEGCYGNPMWGGSFGFPMEPATLKAVPEDKNLHDYGFSVKSIGVNLVSLSNGGYSQKYIESDFNIVRKRHNNCDNWIADLTACYDWVGTANGKVGPEPVVYKSDKEKYSTPDGQSIFINCLPLASVSRFGCEVIYQLDDNTGMFYRFDRRKLPARFSIEYDKAVREEVSKMEVKNYQWAQ